MTNIRKCRTCGSDSVSLVGVLPDSNVFAGRELPSPISGGDLLHCRVCGFAFRHPLLPQSTYDNLYRNGALDVWDGDKARADLALIRSYLDKQPGDAVSVVDVGCYTGQFLASLPERFLRYGVEANVKAAEAARSRAVAILAGSVEEFASISETFDVIIACDVIEHLENPLRFLRQLSSRLNKSGQLIISTGNYDSWLWSLVGAKFWYCYFPEHISFIGPKWLKSVQGSSGLRLRHIIPFNYTGGRFGIKQILAALLFASSEPLFRLLRRNKYHGQPFAGPPGCGGTKDHMLCIFDVTPTPN